MSGALLPAVIGAVSEILGLGGGDIVLGDAVLTDLALPGRMTWGGGQRLIRHVAPGGVVTISSLGPDWRPIQWRGVLEGPLASAQAQQLHAMMLAAAAIPLAWMDQQWIVVIQDFYADDTTAGWVPYRITCAVCADPSQLLGPGEPTLSDQVLGDISDALGFDVVNAGDTAMAALTNVQTLAGAANALTLGSGAFTALSAAVGAAQADVGGAISLAESSVTGLGGAAVAGAMAAQNWVNGAVTQAGNLLNAVAANGLISRIATNLANAST